jgi:EpsI family protein
MIPQTSRRNLLIGFGCLGSLGAAEALRPRRHVSLLGGKTLNDVIPQTLPGWTSVDQTDLVKPREEDSLAARLYSQTVGRLYTETESGFRVMMLAAYGQTQSRDLQLHRPESCYPAVGFSISGSQPARIPLAGGKTLPARRLVAQLSTRRESIVYWSRVGEHIPLSGMEQRLDVLRTAFAGELADGLLLRVSALGAEPKLIFPQLEGFIVALLGAARPAVRPALIGHELSSAIV